MSISEAQLETWSHQGSTVQSARTYSTVKGSLEAAGTPYASKDYAVFLQGSYGNDTNIYAESDVDVVIRLDSSFQSDLDRLAEDEKQAYHATFPNAAYRFVEFKKDVTAALKASFGNNVSVGTKAIAIAGEGSRRKTDVIASLQYRRYYKFRSLSDQSYSEGLCFLLSDGSLIPNFPKQHSANLTSKHQGSGGRFKPIARVFKNLRSELEAKGRISKGSAPSFFVEGMLYNVPSEKFGATFQQGVINSIQWLLEEAKVSELLCANEQFYLVREGNHNCWPLANYDGFLRAAKHFWDNG